MKAAARLLAIGALAFGVPVSAALPCSAQAPGSNSAGLIVQFDATDVREYCVTLDGDDTALDALFRTGLAVETGSGLGGDNVPICRVEGMGCPADDCFCRCTDVDGPCDFWTYWRMKPGEEWRFLQTGPGVTRVRAGEVHAFRWGAREEARPRDADAGGVCARGVAVGATLKPVDVDRGTSPPWPRVALGALVVAGLAALVVRARSAGGAP